MSTFQRCALVVDVLKFLTGCGAEEVTPVVAAKGIVKIKGTPAANIMVLVVPDGKQETGLISSTGIPDSEGHLQRVASDGRGVAVPGPGQILLTETEEERPAQGEISTKAPRLLLEHGVLGTGSLAATVEKGAELTVDVETR